MIHFPFAKINLGLYVTGKRDDGYHTIESLFFPIDLRDAVEVIPAQKNELLIYGNRIPGAKEANSCWQALELMQQTFASDYYHIHLLKRIPAGAGLGGGSADASAILQLINEVEKRDLSSETMLELALKLGSDNAFFMQQKAQFVTGRGEILTPCSMNLSGTPVVLIYPRINHSTKKAYQTIQLEQPQMDLQTLTEEEFREHPNQVKNAFEAPFLEAFPQTEEILVQLENAGAYYASLSGSGSCFYGLFEKQSDISGELAHFASRNHYQYFETTIL